MSAATTVRFYRIRSNVNPLLGSTIQWSAVRVTPSGIGKSVTVTDCHSNSVTLIVLNVTVIAVSLTTDDRSTLRLSTKSIHLMSSPASSVGRA